MSSSDDVTIMLVYGDQAVEITAISLKQAKIRMSAAWSSLFPEGPQREAAAFEVAMTEVAETLRAQQKQGAVA